MSDVKRFDGGPPFLGGLEPQLLGVANFAPAAGFSMLAVANYLDAILAKRLKVLFSWWTDQSNVNNPDTPARALIFVSPNVYGDTNTTKYLRARLVLTAGRYDAASKPAPQVALKLRGFTGAGSSFSYAPTVIDNTHRDANIGPHNYWSIDVEIALGDTGRGQTYELRVDTQDLCQVISMTVFEVPRLALTSDLDDSFVVGKDFFLGGRVYDEADLKRLWQLLQTTYDRQGSVHFAWAPMDSSKAASLGATLTNLFDANTAWDLAARGFWCWPRHHGTMDSDDFGVVIWAIVEIVAADVAAGEFLGAVAFVTEYVTIGTIDVQNYQDGGTVVAAIALQTRWTGGGSQADGKVDVLGSYSGGNTLKVLACGMYDKEPLDPRSIPDLALWLAADRLALADGDPVATWADRSGNGNDAAQASGGSQPTFHTAQIAGLPAVRFDGSNDYLSIADSDTFKADKLTVFMVARVTGGGADMIAIGYPHDVTHTSPFFRWALDFRTASDVHLIVASDVEDATADFATSTLFRTWMYSTHERRLHRDGAAMHANAVSAPTVTYPHAVGLYIGADVAGGEPFQGDIAEILVFARKLTAEEYRAVDQYLSEKYGLQRSPT